MKKLITLISILIALGAAWWLGSPLFLNKTIDEEFPAIESSEKTDEMTLEKFDKMLDDHAKKIVEEKGLDAIDEVEQAMIEKAAELPDIMIKEEMKSEGPSLMAQGEFFDADDFHQGSGTVKLFKNPDGSHLIRLENFEVTNGPDLFVYLTGSKGAKTSKEVKANFYNAGRLKGNKGNQNYVIPADVDISQYKGVSIYCRAFSVLFSSAELN